MTLRNTYLQCDSEAVYGEAEDEDRERRRWCREDVCNHLRDGSYGNEPSQRTHKIWHGLITDLAPLSRVEQIC